MRRGDLRLGWCASIATSITTVVAPRTCRGPVRCEVQSFPQTSPWGRHAYAIVVACAIIAGVALRWPALDAGPGSDDYMQYATLEGKYPVERSALDLFNFSDGSAQETQALKDYGSVPWWTAPQLRLAMLRPLSSALVIFDRSVLGDRPTLHHIHTMLWWAALVIVVAILLRRLFSGPVAALAVVAFVFEEGHGMPVVWLANRGALVSLFFGVLGLIAHMRYREAGDRRAQALSIAAFVLGLLSGEWVFPVFGYLIAYELLGASGSLPRRALALLPVGTLAVAFLAIRSGLRYGALHSGVYIDPVTEPMHYLVAATQRIPVFFADLVFGIPAVQYSFGTPWRDIVLGWNIFPPEIWAQLPGWRTWHVVLGVTAMILLAWAVRSTLVQNERGERPTALRWLLVGSLLSMLPVLASFPSSRLVMPASVGIFATLAATALAWAGRVARSWREQRRVALWPLLGLCAVAYMQLWVAGTSSRGQVHFVSAQYEAVREWVKHADLDDTRLADQRIVLMSTTEHTLAVFLPFVLHYQGRPMPLSSWTLSGAMVPHDVHRTASNVLEVVALFGGFGTNAMEQLYRDTRFGLRVGDRVTLDGLEVEVLDALRGFPRRVRFTFDRNVDDPSMVFLEATPVGLKRFVVPRIGAAARLRRSAFPTPGAMDRVIATRDANVTCVGQRPLIDDCTLGQAHADCGGVGDPVLACHGFGDCRWFAGGCVAVGYVASFCTTDDACCQDGWPYHDFDAFDEAPGAQAVEALLHGWGEQPWDTQREMNVVAALDPEVLPGVPSVRCSAGDGPCDGGRVRMLGYYTHSFSFALEPPLGSSDWGLSVDVIEDPRRGLISRVCRTSQPERFHAECPRTPAPSCAVDGELFLGKLPRYPAEVGQIGMRLRARFEDGDEVEVTL